MLTKEEYEARINLSAIFEIDKKIEPIRYETEKRIFLKTLTEYYVRFIYPNRPLESYSLIFIETACECIRYYDRAKGKFLHLFNVALKRSMRIAMAKEQEEKYRQGIRLSGEDSDAIRKIIVFAKNKGLNIYEIDCQQKIAQILGMKPERVAELIFINENATVIPNVVESEEGEIDLFEMLPDTVNSAEEDTVDRLSAIELLKKVESVFSECQDRQKKMFSLILTVEVIKAFDEDVKMAQAVLSGFSFCREECFLYYEENKVVYTARQIAQMCGVSEQSLSRAYKNFKEKIGKRN